MVSDVWIVEPAPVVAHEIPHAFAGLARGGMEKRQRAVEDRRPAGVLAAPLEFQGDDSSRATSSTQ